MRIISWLKHGLINVHAVWECVEETCRTLNTWYSLNTWCHKSLSITHSHAHLFHLKSPLFLCPLTVCAPQKQWFPWMKWTIDPLLLLTHIITLGSPKGSWVICCAMPPLVQAETHLHPHAQTHTYCTRYIWAILICKMSTSGAAKRTN